MNKLKLAVISGIVFALTVAKPVLADTIGYADFKKIENNYAYAQKTYKEIDDKILGLQQYLINKDKEYKSIESPLSKKNFEEKTEKEYKAKEDAVLKLKLQKEEEIFNNIQTASKIVSAEKKIDVVFDYRVILTGGVDLTQDIINYLNGNKLPAKK
ncbi:MAG: OmpH family outer membrane protein [Candidatus Gastranaerophilaceae bacterium]|jgi:Skp family chaperone for outer membrane proteins